MKKLFTAILCLALILSCTAAFAASDTTAEYASTREFIKWLEHEGIEYENRGLTEETQTERIRFTYDGLTFVYFFNPNETYTSMYCWNLITYTPDKFVEVMEACNTLNQNYRYVRFYCDTSDNTVTAYMDMIYRNYNVDAILGEATERMSSIIHKSVDVLQPFNQ